VFLPPDNPGPVATILVWITAAHIAKMTWLHTSATRVYRTYHNVDQTFKKMVIYAF
jgi:hypothetical protein